MREDRLIAEDCVRVHLVKVQTYIGYIITTEKDWKELLVYLSEIDY